MTGAKAVALLLSDLGVAKTHSRPQVSNDNPFSEAQFKTLKYRPQFPQRFGSLEDARAFCRGFFRWYNEEHRHSGVAYMRPADVHHGRAQEVIETRSEALEKAYATHPERFKGNKPVPKPVPEKVWINPPPESGENDLGEVA